MIPLHHMAGKNVGVLGLGATGRATAAALQASGAHVTAWDDNAAARENAEGLRLADLSGQALDILVSSPGIPMSYPKPHPAIASAQARGAVVCGDVELFSQARASLPDHKVVSITGTNGKSTTTAVIAHILNQAGIAAVIGGNFGPPMLSLEPRECIYVLELSSFQLEQTFTLASDVAVFLNLSPDHRDRYASMQSYAAAKQRLFEMQGSDGLAIIAIDDEEGQRLSQQVAGRVIPVSGKAPAGAIWAVKEGVLVHQEKPVSQQKDWPALQGPHNAQNAAAAAAACASVGAADTDIASGLESYVALPHRSQPVGQVGKVRFINDSKATNPDATAKSLKAFDAIYWLAGGSDKDSDFSALSSCSDNVRAAYFFGQTGSRLKNEVTGIASTLFITMEDAFAAALSDAKDSKGAATILLSPACASFDQFRNFAHRGDVFAALVGQTMAREAS